MISSAFPSTTPCGNLFFVPAKIYENTIQKNRHYVFMVAGSDISKSYIVTFSPEKTSNLSLDYLYTGPTEDVVAFFAELPWPEGEMDDENGFFFYKEAPSSESIKNAFVTH